MQQASFPFWNDYTKLSSLTGNTQVLIRQLKSRISSTEITKKHKLTLQNMLMKALLASDQTEKAGELLLELIAHSDTQQKARLALKLVELGDLLNNKKWLNSGLAICEEVWEEQKQKNVTHENAFYQQYVKKLRSLDKTIAAEKVVFEQITLYTTLMKGYSEAAGMDMGSQLSLLLRPLAIELLGIYADARHWEDILYFTENFPFWGEQDLSDFLTEVDSNKAPVGLFIIEALINTGKTNQAIPLLAALIKQKGGLDKAYELFTQSTGQNAISFLDERYQDDPFEERPLIWKASLLLKAGQLEQAKAAVLQAIKIDPSDGEQGTGDRMRAYSIMADILTAEGDIEGADFNRRAVQAIRLSEQADRFNEAGMFTCAINMYSEASSKFKDAYCIQSRLALQMTRQGRFDAAAEHYQKAFELMPDSFGRVESHCFGCENVFKDARAQGIADQVFEKLLLTQPLKPQVHYMFGYLKKEQGQFLEAIPHFRKAVALDPQYLNAWKQFYQLGEHVYIESWERDIAALKILQLDPFRRHAKVNLGEVSDLKGLWTNSDKAIKINRDKPKQLYPLLESTRKLTANNQKSASSMEKKLSAFGYGNSKLKYATPGLFLTQSKLIGSIIKLNSLEF